MLALSHSADFGQNFARNRSDFLLIFFANSCVFCHAKHFPDFRHIFASEFGKFDQNLSKINIPIGKFDQNRSKINIPITHFSCSFVNMTDLGQILKFPTHENKGPLPNFCGFSMSFFLKTCQNCTFLTKIK